MYKNLSSFVVVSTSYIGWDIRTKYRIQDVFAGKECAFKDILYIKDLCQMMYKALFAQVDGGTYNAGTGIRTTLREQIEGIVDVFSPKEHRSNIVEKPEKSSFTSFVMDIENAKKDLGYKPEFSYIRYLQDYKNEQELNRFAELWRK